MTTGVGKHRRAVALAESRVGPVNLVMRGLHHECGERGNSYCPQKDRQSHLWSGMGCFSFNQVEIDFRDLLVMEVSDSVLPGRSTALGSTTRLEWSGNGECSCI